MNEPDVVAAVLWAGVTLYAVLGGADFGGGLWDLAAGGDRGGERPRAFIDRSITPVWEANHVWLIFCLVVLWTGFPDAFAAVMSSLYVPLLLAALGIVLRGSGFAFRKVVHRLSGRRAFGAAFAISSLLTPFFMGTVVGAVASGRVAPDGEGGGAETWLNGTSILVGVLFVATSAYLAAVFLVHDARRTGDGEMERYFARRGLGTAVVAGGLAAAGLLVVHQDARHVYDGLVGDALPLVGASLVCGLAALALLARRRPRPARALAAGAVVAVVWAWGVAQHPFLLPETLTVQAAAAPDATLTALLVVFGFAALLVVPALVLLFSLHQRSLLEE